MHRTTTSRPHTLALWLRLPAILLAILLFAGCRSPQVTGEDITVGIAADGTNHNAIIPWGSTVGQALAAAGIQARDQDRIEPPPYTVLNNGDLVTITRVQEVFETQEQIIPFERQVVRNESLPEGQTRLVQEGVNGRLELTYRRVLENGSEISKSIVKTVILQDALPEIMMVGAQTSFAPLPIPGKLAYLSGGNAWLIDTSTANRTALVTTGDLDGRVFNTSSIPSNTSSSGWPRLGLW